MQTDTIACLIVSYGGTDMSLTVTFLEGPTLLLQNISVCVLSDLVCMSCTLQDFSGMCAVNPKALSLEWLQSAQATFLPS